MIILGVTLILFNKIWGLTHSNASILIKKNPSNYCICKRLILPPLFCAVKWVPKQHIPCSVSCNLRLPWTETTRESQCKSQLAKPFCHCLADSWLRINRSIAFFFFMTKLNLQFSTALSVSQHWRVASSSCIAVLHSPCPAGNMGLWDPSHGCHASWNQDVMEKVKRCLAVTKTHLTPTSSNQLPHPTRRLPRGSGF